MACFNKARDLVGSCSGVELVQIIDYSASIAGALRNRLVVRLPFRGALPLGSEEWEVEFCG
jgi:hypothetical protein